MKKLLIGTMCCATALALTSCGGSTSTDGLSIGMKADISTLDVQQNNAVTTSAIAEGYAGLLVREVGGKVQPDLATSWTHSVADTGQETFVFTMREDIKWSNGDAITAHDFEFGWKNVYTRVEATSSWQAYGFISGTNELASWMEENKTATRAQILEKADEFIEVKASADGKTLTVKTNFGEGGLVRFASNELSPTNEAFYNTVDPTDTKEYGRDVDTMIYSGAYIPTKFVLNSYVTLEKNDEYWDAENIKHDKVTFRYYKDEQALINAYKKGEVDVMTGSGADYYSEFGDSDEYYTFDAPTGNLNLMLNFNNHADATYETAADGQKVMTSNPVSEISKLLQNRDFVNALSNAFDRTNMFSKSIVGSGYVGSNTIIPANASANDGTDAKITKIQAKYTNPHPISLEADKAKAYLADAMETLGYTDKNKIPTINIITAQKEITDYIVNEVNQTLGYKALATENMDFGTRSNHLVYHTFDILLFGWGVSFDDASGFINDYVTTSYFTGDWGVGGIHEDSYNVYKTACDAAAASSDYETRAAEMATMEETILQSGPAIPVAGIATAMIIKSNLKGITARPFGNEFDYLYSYFE